MEWGKIVFLFIVVFTRNSAIRGLWLHHVLCNGLQRDRDVISSARKHFDYYCLVLPVNVLLFSTDPSIISFKAELGSDTYRCTLRPTDEIAI